LKVRIFRLLLLIKKQIQGASAMRFDVPNVGDPLELIQVLFFAETSRDLSGYDALTFWARELKQNNFKYFQVLDASKLRAERDCFGMLKEQKMVKVIPFGSMN
jgi:hypothetical protein